MKDRRVRFVLDMYQAAKEAKKRHVETWDKCWSFYIGNQWGQGKRAAPYLSDEEEDWRAKIAVNFIFSTVETIIPIYLDAQPNIYVYPTKPEFQEQADMLGKVKDHIWRKANMRERLGQVGSHIAVYGTAFFYVFWNERTEDVDVDVLSPKHVFVDPDATCLEDAQFILTARPMSLFEIRRRWGEKAKGVKPEAPDIELEYVDSEQDAATSSELVSPVDRVQTIDDSGTLTSADGTTYTPRLEEAYPADGSEDLRYSRERVTLYDCWFRDLQTMDEKVERSGEEGKAKKTRKLRYPSGRRILLAGGKILEDGPNPYAHGLFPFVRVVNYDLPDSIWGMGDVEQLIPLQMELNKSKSLFIDHRNLMCQPQWWIHDGSVNEEEVSNRPGSVLWWRGEHPPQRAQIATLPGWMWRLMDGTKQEIEQVSGIHDVTQGRRPAGIESGKAIIALQESANTRIRKKSANLEQSLKKLGYLLLKTAQELYDPFEKYIPILGEDQGLQYEMIQMKELQIDFDVEVEMGSTLPNNPEANQEAIMKFAEMGTVDPIDVLELAYRQLRIPGLKKILEQKRGAEEGGAPPGPSMPEGPPGPPGGAPPPPPP